MSDKPAGTDPITFTDPADVCAAITGAFVTGWKAEAVRYLAWWTEHARAASAPTPSGPEGHAHDPDDAAAIRKRDGVYTDENVGAALARAREEGRREEEAKTRAIVAEFLALPFASRALENLDHGIGTGTIEGQAWLALRSLSPRGSGKAGA